MKSLLKIFAKYRTKRNRRYFYRAPPGFSAGAAEEGEDDEGSSDAMVVQGCRCRWLRVDADEGGNCQWMMQLFADPPTGGRRDVEGMRLQLFADHLVAETTGAFVGGHRSSVARGSATLELPVAHGAATAHTGSALSVALCICSFARNGD